MPGGSGGGLATDLAATGITMAVLVVLCGLAAYFMRRRERHPGGREDGIRLMQLKSVRLSAGAQALEEARRRAAPQLDAIGAAADKGVPALLLHIYEHHPPQQASQRLADLQMLPFSDPNFWRRPLLLATRDFHPDRAPARAGTSGEGGGEAGRAEADGADGDEGNDPAEGEAMVWHLLSLEIAQQLGQKRTESRDPHTALES